MSFGFKSWNSDGVTAIDETEVSVRHVATVFVAYNFSGDISVPDFDSNYGAIIPTYYYTKYRFTTSSKVSDTTSLLVDGVDILNQFGTEGNRFSSTPPTLSWNNTTKIITITANSPVLCDVQLTFLHYK